MHPKRILSFVLITLILASVFPLAIPAQAATKYEAYAKKLDRRTYDGKLGAIYTKNYTKFRVWAPTSDDVKVMLYKTGSSTEYYKQIAMKYSKSQGVWYTTVKGNLKNVYYTYRFERKGKTYETYDIYARASGVNGKKSMVVDLDSTDPKGWEKDSHVTVDSPTKARIWEVQISDFSSSETSGVSRENRGKYLAFTETGTTVNSISGAQSTCVDYLKELGVNYVHINPFYDFGSVDESDTSDNDDNYNWGYDPVNYNVPEGSYSSNPSKGAVRIRECKQMIQALHNAGIGVIMDVVYNHTHEWKKSAFELTVPNYYYRMNADGTYSNGSGCGNDTASEHKMFRKYMIDSVTYWASEYHIDGFRFDLMGLHDVDTMNSIRKALDKLPDGEKLLMYGEPWNLTTAADDGTLLANTNNIAKLDTRIAAFDDTYRDAVKGSTGGADQGFVQSGANRSNLKTGISGQASETTGWAKAPTQTVTYASCHDNLTLWDKLVKSVKGADGKYDTRYNDLVAMNKLTGAITFTSQGLSFILAGEEFCRTKNGDENSYSSGKALNQLDWMSLETYGDVVDYYKGLIEIRKNISAFSDPTSATANSINYFDDMPNGVIAYSINDPVYSKVVVIFNSSEETATVNIDGTYAQLADATTAGMQNLGTVTDKVKISSKSAAVLVDKSSFDSVKTDSDTGKVVVRYNANSEIFKSYVINGKIGDSFNIAPLSTVLMDYNIKKTSGESGTFSDTVHYCDFECEKYDGDYSSVTFMFVDDEDRQIYDSIVMTNRQGQPYMTLSIPSIDGYSLDLEKLPKNGCGTFSKKDKTIKYQYTERTSDDAICKVNIVYMSTDGKVLSTDTKNVDRGTAYSTTQIEFEGYDFVSVTDNSSGSFIETEQNILYIYAPVSFASNLPVIIVIVAVIALLSVMVFFYYRSQKNKLKKKIDIG